MLRRDPFLNLFFDVIYPLRLIPPEIIPKLAVSRVGLPDS